MWRNPRRFCRHDVLILLSCPAIIFQKDSHAARRIPGNV
jgi:hypothetical protein